MEIYVLLTIMAIFGIMYRIGQFEYERREEEKHSSN